MGLLTPTIIDIATLLGVALGLLTVAIKQVINQTKENRG